MAQFYPTFDDAVFASAGEAHLFRALEALDDEFIVIHSLPWLRGSVKRAFSKETLEYIDAFRSDRNHISGEIDFVIMHPKYGMLCVEVKDGALRPLGARFIRDSNGEIVDPLVQAKDNAFSLFRTLKAHGLKCPVGYAIHLPKTDIGSSGISLSYKPIDGRHIDDGVLLLPRHMRRVTARVLELMNFWKLALNYPESSRFDGEIAAFLRSVWPDELQSNDVGRKIAADGKLWLQLDRTQSGHVNDCLRMDRRIIAGYSGSGKTLIARALAEEFSAAGSRVLLLFKNRLISQNVGALLKAANCRKAVTRTFHAYCEGLDPSLRAAPGRSPNYEEHFRALEGKTDGTYDALIVDEAQALSESEHEALLAHFGRAKIFIFADAMQVLPKIESGVSYEFLEKTYGSRVFYLSNVYRCPGGVIGRMLEMRRPENHEVNPVRQESDADYRRQISWSVKRSVEDEVNALLARGARESDIVVLSQFGNDIAVPPGIAHHSISAYRGMESPIAIVVPRLETDDGTLACAMGRATSQVIILVPAHLKIAEDRVRSEFIRSGLAQLEKSAFYALDARRPYPLLAENCVTRYANSRAEHSFAGTTFSYSPVWKFWIVAADTWPNQAAALWGILLERHTGARVTGIDTARNEPTAGYFGGCETCGTVTINDPFGKCLACDAAEISENLVESVPDWCDLTSSVELEHCQSLLNVALLVANYQFPKYDSTIRSRLSQGELGLAGIVVEFHMRSSSPRATSENIRAWLDAVLIESELENSIAHLATTVVNSLCAQKKIRKVGHHAYGLI